MPDEFYVYFSFYVLLAVAGIIYQEKELLWNKFKKGGDASDSKSKKGKKGGEHGDLFEEEKEDEEQLLKKKGNKKK